MVKRSVNSFAEPVTGLARRRVGSRGALERLARTGAVQRARGRRGSVAGTVEWGVRILLGCAILQAPAGRIDEL